MLNDGHEAAPAPAHAPSLKGGLTMCKQYRILFAVLALVMCVQVPMWIVWPELHSMMLRARRNGSNISDLFAFSSRSTSGFKCEIQVCTSLGDRFSAYLTVAAAAQALNKVCHASWCDHNTGSRYYYRWADVSQYVKMPPSLVILSQHEYENLDNTFDILQLRIKSDDAANEYEGERRQISSKSDLQSFQQTAYESLRLPRSLVDELSAEKFNAALAHTLKQFEIFSDAAQFPREYLALFVQGSDANRDFSVGSYQPMYHARMEEARNESMPPMPNEECFQHAARFIESTQLPTILLSDSDELLRDVLSDFGHFLVVTNSKNQSKLALEMRDLALMMRAVGLVQYSISNRSSHVSLAARLRSIPLYNIWRDEWSNSGTLDLQSSSFLECNSSHPTISVQEFEKKLKGKLEESTTRIRTVPPVSTDCSTKRKDFAPGKKFLKYDRRLCSGLGDRLSVYLTVAALASAVNATCYAYWCEDNADPRLYLWSDVSKYTTWPSSLIMLTKKDFDAQTVGVKDIKYEDAELPAGYAYDGVYTLAHKTMLLPAEYGEKIHYPSFLEAYRRVVQEFDIAFDLEEFPPEFLVLHVRESDKVRDYIVDGYRPKYEYMLDGLLNRTTPKEASYYCTSEVLEWLENIDVPVIVVSEDNSAKRRVLSDFGHSLVLPNNKGMSKVMIEMRDLALMLRSVGIVQHVEDAWSSFSSVPAMARRTPLFSSWRGGFIRLDDFVGRGGKPDELMSCDRTDAMVSIRKFGEALSAKRLAWGKENLELQLKANEAGSANDTKHVKC